MKRAQGRRDGLPSFSQHPELQPSLVELIERQRYSLTDVALFFGVSRECIRQWCKREGIRPRGKRWSSANGLNSVRVWDDALNQFRPVGKGDHHAQHQQAYGKRYWAIRNHVRAEYRAHILDALRALHTRLERAPSAVEMWEAVSGRRLPVGRAGGALVSAWASAKGVDRTIASLADLHRTAGVPSRPRGTPGHLHRRA